MYACTVLPLVIMCNIVTYDTYICFDCTGQDLNELEESLQTKHRDLEESDELNEQLRSELENASECTHYAVGYQ